MTYKYIITQSLAMLMSLASNAFEVKSGQMVVVSADTARMEPVAKTALKMLKGDIRKVLGSEMKLVNTSVNSSIILQRDAAAFAYKKEAFLLKSAHGCLYIKVAMIMDWLTASSRCLASWAFHRGNGGQMPSLSSSRHSP